MRVWVWVCACWVCGCVLGGPTHVSVLAPLFLVFCVWRCLTLPQPPGCSTISVLGLSFQVRNGYWAFPLGYDHHTKLCVSTPKNVFWLVGGLVVNRIVVCVQNLNVCSFSLLCSPPFNTWHQVVSSCRRWGGLFPALASPLFLGSVMSLFFLFDY